MVNSLIKNNKHLEMILGDQMILKTVIDFLCQTEGFIYTAYKTKEDAIKNSTQLTKSSQSYLFSPLSKETSNLPCFILYKERVNSKEKIS